MIIACVSTYNEGQLLGTCVASGEAGCDRVLVAEGPVGEMKDDTTTGRAGYTRGGWVSDAAKRTYLLQWAKRVHKAANSKQQKEPLWVLWLDGDEVLIWPEYLRDWTHRAEEETGTGGFPLRLVELDGSVAMCYGKIIRAEVVRKYLHSSYQVELHTGMTVALPNVKVCGAGGIPYGQVPTSMVQNPGNLMLESVLATPGSPEMEEFLARHRPPVAGEPHLLHRSMLRSTEREAGRRLSDVEGDWFDETIKASGLEGV